MLTKTEFILLFNRIKSGETVSDEEFEGIINIFKMQRLVSYDYLIDTTLTQTQTILNIICQNSIKFYEIYLGQ